MPSTSSNTTTVLRQTLFASTTYELLHMAQLIILTATLSRTDAAAYALIMCFATIAGKFIDAGAGASAPRFLKISSQYPIRSLLSVVFQQTIILIPLVTLGIAYSIHPNREILLLIMIRGTCEALASISRHAIYSTLQSSQFAFTEITFKTVQLITLIVMCLTVGASYQYIIATFSLFYVINTILISHLAWQQCVRSPASQSITSKQSITSNNNPSLSPWTLHKTVGTLRLQVFSTKFSKDFLSTYILTPLFAYTHGIEFTWMFFLLTSTISSLQTIIKMTIGYSAAGIFTQTNHHAKPTKHLNKALVRLVLVAVSLVGASYIILINTLFSAPQAQNAILCVTCFAILSFTDLIPLVYEQYLLVSGRYATYQRLRMIEYGLLALLGITIGRTFGMVPATISFIITKLCILMFVRASARSQFLLFLTKSPTPAPVPTPTFFTPPISTPTAHTPKLSSPQAPTQRERLG
jgi:hypothetical protein